MERNKKNLFFNFTLLPILTWALGQKRLVLSLFALLFLSACETVVEIDIPVEKPKLVVNSIFNADSILTVNVTKSRPSSESGLDFEKVENAVVEVFKNKQSLGLLIYQGNGNYKTLNKFPNEPNAEYTIEVKASGFEAAESTEIMSAKPVIHSIVVEPDKQNSNSSYKYYNSRFAFQDPSENNFYFLRAWLVSQNGKRSPLQTELKNILGQFSPLRSEYLQIHVFDDRSFNGKEITIDLGIAQTYVGTTGNHTVLFELASINKSYFDYLYSVKRQFEDIPLLEPKNLPLSNNIKNGLGIFAPYNAASFSFDVER